MTDIFVKIKQRERANKYRKPLTIDENIYPKLKLPIESSYPYSPGTTLESEEWFLITAASKEEFAHDLLNLRLNSTVDYSTMQRTEFVKVDFILANVGEYLLFQNVPKSRLVTKRWIGCFGNEFKYQNDCKAIIINDFPDAIQYKQTDALYFHKLEAVTSIFKGIDQLYREATDVETSEFLKEGFICLVNGYCESKVKTANRKRIALACNILETLSENDRANIFAYIGEYCPNLKATDCSFKIGTENELKMLLYGIEQRFYTTAVGEEKRIANSIIVLDKGKQ